MPAEDGFKTLFEDLILEFYVFMGRTIRFVNQNTAIKVMAIMNDGSSVCVVMMDCKMKLNMMKHRDNEVGRFVKRGLS